MTPLTEFLLARIAEDEQLDRARLVTSHMGTGASYEEIENCLTRTLPWQAIGFRRASRELAVTMAGTLKGLNASWLRLLALPYADHPDYDETWRP